MEQLFVAGAGAGFAIGIVAMFASWGLTIGIRLFKHI